MERTGVFYNRIVLLWGSGVIVDLKMSGVIVDLKIRIFYHFGAWPSDRYEGVLNLFYAPETDFGPRWIQAPENDLF